jgi:hypothetical protein
MAEYRNTHPITADCKQFRDYVLGNVDGRRMIGVTLGPGGWKPAREARAADLEYFGEQPTNKEKN